MLHVLTGEDGFSRGQALAEIKRGIGDDTVLAANTTVFDGQRLGLDELKGACETVPFLAEKRLVIVEGLLGRYDAKAKSGRKKAPRQDEQNEVQAIADYAPHLPEFTELVLVEGKLDGRNPLLRRLAEITRVRDFAPLKAAALRQWLGRRVTEAGGSISPAAVERMVRFVGSDLRLMANEVDKLVMFAGGRRIEEGDVQELVSAAQEASIFALVDAILEFRIGAAQEILQQLLAHGVVPTHVLVMLARQARIIYLVKDMRRQRRPRQEIQQKLGLAHDFVLRKAWEQADRYSAARLREVYHRLLEADLAIKTGKYNDELTINILIAELGQRGLSPVQPLTE